MNTFTNSIDEKTKDEYDLMIFDFFEGQFDKAKKDWIDETVSKIVEKRDFKILCGFLHVFIDNLLCEQFIKKDCHQLNYFGAYIYFMKSIDAYIELPISYYKNKIVCFKKDDTYYNYYVSLRTLIDHNLISYRKYKLNPQVKSYITSMGRKMAKKPKYDYSPESPLINEIFDLILEHYPERTIKKTYKDIYDLYLINKNKKEGYDYETYEFIRNIHQSIKFYDEAKFNDLVFNAVRDQDAYKIIYVLFEFFEFNNEYAYHAQKFISIFVYVHLFDEIKGIYVEEKDIIKYGKLPVTWENHKYNYVDCFDIIRTLIARHLSFTIDAQGYELNLVLDHQSEIFKFIYELLRVNKHYTDILGKGLDQYYISYFADLFDADFMVLGFGSRAGSVDFNALIYLAAVFCYLNNVTSTDYEEDIEDDIKAGFESFLHPDELPDFYEADEGAIGECSRFVKHFLGELKHAYRDIYGIRINPMKNIGNTLKDN